MIVAGIMSGTSLDGIDVALIEIDDEGFDTLGFLSVPYAAGVREALLGISNCETHTREIARLHFLLPELYAEAFFQVCKDAEIAPASVELIGCHGQTIFHEGEAVRVQGRRVASTLQIGDGSVLAERTGRPVVSDFRTRDIAAGGRGAPLVPFVDYLLFRSPDTARIAVNIGGIANITVIPAGCAPEDVIAFDTGPGNMVIDQLAARLSEGRQTFDRGGEWAASGTVDASILAGLLTDPYYTQAPPKTAGREQYGEEFIQRLLSHRAAPADLLATATMLTAASIAEGVYRFGHAEDEEPEIIVSGGGVHNLTLMRMLRAELADCDVMSSGELGLNPDAKEAIAFAILARETWRGKPSNLPSATGAKRQVVLGKLSS